MTFWRLRVSEREFNEKYTGDFGEPECWKYNVPITGKYTEHKGIINKFVRSILYEDKLLAPGEEAKRITNF